MATLRWVGVLWMTGLMAIGSAMAAEQKLEFKLITTMASGNSLDAPNVEGHKVGAGNYVGVAVFDDGRLAFKEFVLAMDNAGDTGTYSGYSTYTFENGDSLTLKFIGGWGSDGAGGDYEVLSSTGAYTNATGTGRFDAVKDAWDKASLYDGRITLTLGGS